MTRTKGRESVDTRDAIRTEFMRIYERERMERITVKGLCAAVPVARTTFYAHYRNVDDVLLDVEDRLLAGLAKVTERVSAGDMPHMDFEAFLDETLGFVDRNRTDFHALLVTQPDMRFVSRWKDAMKANMARRYPDARLRRHWDLIAEMGASAIVGAYVWWMKNPDIAGFEEAKQLITHAVEGVMSSI